MFREGSGDWTQYRELESAVEVDFHYSQYGRREVSYDEAMGQVYDEAYEALKRAFEQGIRYVIFTHGSSTSRRGNTTARSQVRSLMRSKQATPFVSRKDCIQHNSVFVAAIRSASDTYNRRSHSEHVPDKGKAKASVAGTIADEIVTRSQDLNYSNFLFTMKWETLDEVGAELKCCVCCSASTDGLAWFPRNADDEMPTLLGLVDPVNRDVDPATLVFCTECKTRAAEMLRE